MTRNLTYRTYGLLTTNQSSYLKQEIKSKKNLTGTDSLIHFFIHSFIHFFIHAFIHSFLPWLPSISPSLIHFFLLYMQTCFHVSSQIFMTCLTKTLTNLLRINYSTTKLMTVLPETGVLGLFEPHGEKNSSVAADPKVPPNWSLKTMTCHSSHCFSIVW